MMHPITLQELARARQRDLLNEAEARRMARQAKATRPAQPGLAERIVHGVGTRLIDTGERRKERHISPQNGALREA